MYLLSSDGFFQNIKYFYYSSKKVLAHYSVCILDLDSVLLKKRDDDFVSLKTIIEACDISNATDGVVFKIRLSNQVKLV